MEYFHPEFSVSKAKNVLIDMKANNWFDKTKLSSFVAELMLYNGNVEKFIHVSFIFEVRANGQVETKMEISPFVVSLYSNDFVNYFRMFLELCVVGLFVFFVIQEISSLTDGVIQYITKPLSWISMASLLMCFICMCFYITYVTSHEFQSIRIPLPPLVGGEMSYDRLDAINALQFLSERSYMVGVIAAVNICTIFIRCVALLASVSPNLGLVVKSLAQGQDSFVCFFFIFALMFLSFALAAHINFGSNIEEFSTLAKALLECLKMVMGDVNFTNLEQNALQPVFLRFWFVIFMSAFYLVLVNVFLSIIVASFNKEMRHLKELIELHGEIDSLQKFISDSIKWIASQFTFLNKLKMLTSIKSGASGKKINFEMVNRLRAKKRQQSYPGSCHCFAVLILFVLFAVMMIRISRIHVAYSLTNVVSEGVRSVEWDDGSGTMTLKYDDIHTMEEVSDFAQAAIVETLYTCIGDADAVESDRHPVKSCGEYKKRVDKFPLEYRTREMEHWVLWNKRGFNGNVAAQSGRRMMEEDSEESSNVDENSKSDNSKEAKIVIHKDGTVGGDNSKRKLDQVIDFRTGQPILGADDPDFAIDEEDRAAFAQFNRESSSGSSSGHSRNSQRKAPT